MLSSEDLEKLADPETQKKLDAEVEIALKAPKITVLWEESKSEDPLKDKVCVECSIPWSIPIISKDSSIQSWAIFTGQDKNVFEYGLNGASLLISDKIFNPGDYLCPSCLANYKNSPYCQIPCANCDQLYREIGYGEAWDCATTILEEDLIPGYGSKYDLQKMFFTVSKPEHLPDKSLICDVCLDQLIANNTITYIPSEPTGSEIPIDILTL